MSIITMFSKTGRIGSYSLANANTAYLRNNKIYYKALPDGTYKVIAKWGMKQTRWPDEVTEIHISSMTPAAKALIKDSLGLRNKVYWVEM